MKKILSLTLSILFFNNILFSIGDGNVNDARKRQNKQLQEQNQQLRELQQKRLDLSKDQEKLEKTFNGLQEELEILQETQFKQLGSQFLSTSREQLNVLRDKLQEVKSYATRVSQIKELKRSNLERRKKLLDDFRTELGQIENAQNELNTSLNNLATELNSLKEEGGQTTRGFFGGLWDYSSSALNKTYKAGSYMVSAPKNIAIGTWNHKGKVIMILATVYALIQFGYVYQESLPATLQYVLNSSWMSYLNQTEAFKAAYTYACVAIKNTKNSEAIEKLVSNLVSAWEKTVGKLGSGWNWTAGKLSSGWNWTTSLFASNNSSSTQTATPTQTATSSTALVRVESIKTQDLVESTETQDSCDFWNDAIYPECSIPSIIKNEGFIEGTKQIFGSVKKQIFGSLF